MCVALFYDTCIIIYIYNILNSFRQWTLNEYYYHCYIFFSVRRTLSQFNGDSDVIGCVCIMC